MREQKEGLYGAPTQPEERALTAYISVSLERDVVQPAHGALTL